MKQHILTPKQEAQLRLLELAATPERDTSRIAAELAAHPQLWQTAEFHAEEDMVDEEEEVPGIALYILTSGSNNVALMQLAIHWGLPIVAWITKEYAEKQRILRCWWDTPLQGGALPN